MATADGSEALQTLQEEIQQKEDDAKNALDQVTTSVQSQMKILQKATVSAKQEIQKGYDALSVVRSKTNAELEEQKREVAEARAALDAEVAQMKAHHDHHAERIKITMDGQVFETSRSTLTKYPESMLGIQFSGRHEFLEDTWLDMNPARFRVVMDFLREDDFCVPSDDQERLMLYKMADYLQLPEMKVRFQPHYDISLLTQEDQAMKQVEDATREAMLQSPGSVADLYDQLDNVFAAGKVDAFTTTTDPKPYPFLFEHRSKHHTGTRPIVASYEDFVENFRFVSGNLLDGLDWSNVFVAGGSVLAALKDVPAYHKEPAKGSEEYIRRMTNWHRGELWRSSYGNHGIESEAGVHPRRWSPAPAESGFGDSDVDLFLYGLSPEAANQKVQAICDQMVHNLFQQSVYYHENQYQGGIGLPMAVVRTEHAITFICNMWYCPRIQIVLRLYNSPAEVLLGFDIDSCCVGFDGRAVWALPRARRAISKGFNLIDPTRQSLTYEVRLMKYAKRGFRVAVPG